MTKYVLANWKSHKTLAEAEGWLEKFSQNYTPHPQVQVIIAPPSLYLAPLRQKLEQSNTAQIALAAQNLSPFPLGAYTGEIAAEMLKDFVDFAIVGHSERRRYFQETNQTVANKVSEAKAAHIKPIVCIDRPYARTQIGAIQEEDLSGIIIGYAPVEAIGINIPQSPAKTREVAGEIQQMAPDTPILYGGSINKDNAEDFLELAGLAGLMVGSASLDPEEFAHICTAASKHAGSL